jgi:DNA adenine methylase
MVRAPLNRYPSPLRYPGGKGKIANYIKLVFIENDLSGYDYVEPYAGGASVALSLLYEDFVTNIQINDVNRSVFAFWDAAVNRADAFCSRISRTSATTEEWHRQKAVQTASSPDPDDLAFSTFFLNRTNRSGIIARGGMIGGLDQTGQWRLDARYNKAELCKRIEKISRFRSRITVTRLDAAELIRRVNRSGNQRVFLYLDPPYYVKGEGLYDCIVRCGARDPGDVQLYEIVEVLARTYSA